MCNSGSVLKLVPCFCTILAAIMDSVSWSRYFLLPSPSLCLLIGELPGGMFVFKIFQNENCLKMDCFLFCSLCSSCVQEEHTAQNKSSKQIEQSRSAPSPVQLHCHYISAIIVYVQELANDKWWSKSSLPPDFVTKLLLKQSHAFVYIKWWPLFHATTVEVSHCNKDTIWTTKSKIFTTCFFIENVCQPWSIAIIYK